MKIGDRGKVTGIPANLNDDDDMRTRTLFQKCVGETFVVAGVQQPQRLPHRLVQLDVGQVVGEQSYLHTIWIEEELVELTPSVS